ncbi:hypothetical protein [Pseudochrobactrum sp. B5]|uniref:hypothetical protein n=1 Tax=Pseudochrobactrum sp. B5 TaxID=1289478 RepID=UPI000951CF2D|nr:hypothetical protein [Pseudochrobactrum sp. B5]
MTSELKPDLSSFGYADGGYMSKCSHCKETFIGAKRAWSCEPCATKKSLKPKITRAAPDVSELVRYRLHWSDFDTADMEIDSMAGEYVLHSQAAEIIAADRAEKHRAQEAVLKLERELAQYEAQEPVAYIQSCDLKWLSHDNYGSITITTTKSTTHTEPLYVSPVPAADLKAENERLREVLTKISSPTQATGLLWWQVEARAALNVEASNDKG